MTISLSRGETICTVWLDYCTSPIAHMKRICLVEDDPAVIDIVRLILGDEYLLISVLNPQTISGVRDTLPDLFLVDRHLHGMIDGLQLCKTLKEDVSTRNIPVILFSASHNLVSMAKEAGADDFLEKPFRISSLRGCIKKHLKS